MPRFVRLALNNSDFIDGLRNHEPAAAKHLHECYVPSIWRFVYYRVDRDQHLAEDIVSEVVLALVSAAAQDVSIENPMAWLRTVAQRRIHDHFRAAARVQHLIEQAEQHVKLIDEHDPSAQHDQQLRHQAVREAMDGLPENYRLALEWKYIDKLSVKVIATRLDTTEKSAESILFRARQALRQKLKKEAPQSAGKEPSTSASRDSASESESNQTRDSVPVTPRLAGES